MHKSSWLLILFLKPLLWRTQEIGMGGRRGGGGIPFSSSVLLYLPVWCSVNAGNRRKASSRRFWASLMGAWYFADKKGEIVDNWQGAVLAFGVLITYSWEHKARSHCRTADPQLTCEHRITTPYPCSIWDYERHRLSKFSKSKKTRLGIYWRKSLWWPRERHISHSAYWAFARWTRIFVCSWRSDVLKSQVR